MRRFSLNLQLIESDKEITVCDLIAHDEEDAYERYRTFLFPAAGLGLIIPSIFMEKDNWLPFLSSRLKSQIFLEAAEKAQNGALAILGLVCFGMAISPVTASEPRAAFYTAKIFFLIFFHVFMLLGFYLPGLLKNRKISRPSLFGIQDFTGLVAISIALLLCSGILFSVSVQMIQGLQEANGSNFFAFISWINFFVSVVYLAGSFFFLLGLNFFPNMLAKFLERLDKTAYGLLGFHSALILLMALAYLAMVPLGGPVFFTDLRISGLFWISIAAAVLLLAKGMRGSCVPALAALELDAASGKLVRHEDLLSRFEEAFIPVRLSVWLSGLTRLVEEKTHQIAGLVHEAVTLVGRQNPTELELRQVEEKYRRAEMISRRLWKENQRFLLSVSFFNAGKAERAKIEELKDHFSRQTRNIKLELSSVRKRIDERLVALKNNELPLPSPSPDPLEEMPLKR